VSRICLGMMSFGDKSSRQWVLEEDAAEPLVKAAADGGVIPWSPLARGVLTGNRTRDGQRPCLATVSRLLGHG
jgi:aryl-alcohol dehydrogenase-like predicted oxidoreductase